MKVRSRIVMYMDVDRQGEKKIRLDVELCMRLQTELGYYVMGGGDYRVSPPPSPHPPPQKKNVHRSLIC